jgi:hypothetical protein
VPETVPHPLTKDLNRRLAFVRYLYRLGVDQSHKPAPFAAVAVLTFHDTCEMFLQIAAEHNGVTPARRSDFLDYWTLFEQQTQLQVTSKVSMDRLNRARVNLKHGGVLPAHDEIEGFRAAVTNFLDDNSLSLLGVNLNEVSLTSMIRSDDVRGPLEKAETALSDGNLPAVMEEVARAFTVSLRRFESRPRSSPYPWGGSYSLRNANASLVRAVGELDELRDVRRTLDRVVDVFAEAITIVAYNLDYDSYLMFKTHAPVVHQMLGGNMIVEWTAQPERTEPEVVQRCLTFVIDTAIRLEALA